MLSIEKLRLAVAGVSITYPLESALPPSKRAARQAAPPSGTMQETIPSDSFPNAPTFDGVDDKLDIPYAAELNPPSFTAEMWVMVQGGSGYQCILTSVSGSPLAGRKGYLFCINPARQWQFWLGNGQPKGFWQVITGSVARQNSWVHLAGAYDRQSQTMIFYVNGREVGRERNVQYQPNDRNPLRVGAGAAEQWGASPCYFQGKITEVKVWDRVLSPSEIQALSTQRSIEVKAERIDDDPPEYDSFGQNMQNTGGIPGQSTGTFPYAQEQATGNFYPNQGQATSNFPPTQGQATGNFYPNQEQATGNFPPTQGQGIRNFGTAPMKSPPVAEKPLNPQQPGSSNSNNSADILWQIGKPGQGGTPTPTGPWMLVYDYVVGRDPDPLERPIIPSCIVPANLTQIPNSTSQLNIHFVLAEDYTEGQLVLGYDRYGSGEDFLFLDGQLIAQTASTEKGKPKQSQIPLGAVQKGLHTVSITTSNGADAAHLIDYLQLQNSQLMASKSTSQTGGLAGKQPPSKGNQSGSQQQSAQSGGKGSGSLGELTPVTNTVGQATGAAGGTGQGLGGVTGVVGGLTGQATGAAGGAGGLVSGLTGQGGGDLLGGLLNQVGGLAGGLPVAGGLVGGLTGQGGGGNGAGGAEGLVGGLVNQVGGVAGGLPIAGGLVGGLTGQGGAGGAGGLLGGVVNQVGGLAGGLPIAGGLVGGLTGQGGAGGAGGLLGGVVNQVGGLAGGLPIAGGLVGGLTGQNGLVGGVLNQVGGLAGGLPIAGGLVGGLTGGLGGGQAGGQLAGAAGISNEAIVQLAAIMQQMNALLAQMNQILGHLAAASQASNAGMLAQQQQQQQQQQQLAQMYNIVSQIPGMTQQILASLTPAQVVQLAQMYAGGGQQVQQQAGCVAPAAQSLVPRPGAQQTNPPVRIQ